MGTIPQLSVLKGDSAPRTDDAGLLSQLSGVKLTQLFDTKASSYPHSTALIYPDLEGKTWRISHGELAVWTNRLARALSTICSGSSANSDGDRIVAVAMAPSHKLVATLLAIWKTGAAYLPLDPNAPPERTRHILTESQPILVITDDDDESCAYGKTRRIRLRELEKETENIAEHPLRAHEALCSSGGDNTVLILYTSGSTGIPKGVRIVESAILNRLYWQWNEFPYLDTEETCVFKTALTFVDSVSEIWGPLLVPGQPRAVLILPTLLTKDPHRLISTLHNYKIQRLVLVPTLLRSILMYMGLSKNKNTMLQNLKLWISSGESLSVSLAEQFLSIFSEHRLCNFYGSTEVMGDVTFHVINSKEDVAVMGKVPIGVPVSNTAVYLLDANMRPVQQGQIGELYAAGRNLAIGYVNKRDANRFIENPHTVDPEYKVLYKTGDYARIVKGTILFEGRIDSQVKVRGHRVDLSEVEAALSKLAGIKKAVVLCYKPTEISQTILGFVLPEDNTVLYDKDIELTLQNFLPSYAIPQIIIIDTLPLLVNGKVDRQSLLGHYEQLCYKEEDEMIFELSDVPTDKQKIAECLFRTVASVLGKRGTISSSANFYSLGGNSLNSVYTVTLLKDQGYIISISDFISAKNLGEIVTRITTDRDDIQLSIKQKHTSCKYSYEILSDSRKDDAYRMIVDSFYYKADLEKWILPKIEKKDYAEFMDCVWPALLETKLSYAIISESGSVIGTSVNFDAYDEPTIKLTSELESVLHFLEYLEAPLREKKLPKGKGKILHSFVMGTDQQLSAGENVEVMEFMEAVNLKIAKDNNFIGVFTTNTNPLTQQLSMDVFNYQPLHRYQVNQYVAPNGKRLFKEAPDEQVALCCWKVI